MNSCLKDELQQKLEPDLKYRRINSAKRKTEPMNLLLQCEQMAKTISAQQEKSN
jgi:hypothetical protein